MNTCENLQSINFNFGLDDLVMGKVSASMHSLSTDEIDHIPFSKPGLLSIDSAIQSSKDIYHSQFSAASEDSNNPKSKQGKNVSWAPELTTSVSTIDNELEEQCLQLITALRHEKCFVETPAMLAVVWMVENDNESKSKVELIAIYLHLKHERYPSSKDILDMLEREGHTESSITSLITKHCRTNSSGLSTLRSICKTFHSKDTLLEHGSLQTSTEHGSLQTATDCLNSISLTSDSSPAVASSLSSSVEIQQCNTNATPSLFKEEQKNFLKLEALKKEQSYLKHSLTCLVCKQRQIDTMLLPCGHVVLCSVCSESCFSCPVCKKTALAEVKTYLS